MTISVNVRQVVGPEDAAKRDTQGLRKDFLIEGLFSKGQINLTYSHLDRMIVGGIVPAEQDLVIDQVKETGTSQFLERREAAILNIGGKGTIIVGDVDYPLGFQDALYVGMGQGTLSFRSHDPANPAEFYLLSAPDTAPARPCRSRSTWPRRCARARLRRPMPVRSTNMCIRMSAKAASF